MEFLVNHGRADAEQLLIFGIGHETRCLGRDGNQTVATTEWFLPPYSDIIIGPFDCFPFMCASDNTINTYIPYYIWDITSHQYYVYILATFIVKIFI